jgi:hypothetical protein
MKLYLGSEEIDTGFNEPAWADPQSWTYTAKAEVESTVSSPAQPFDTALYNMGSTFFPSNLGDRRITLKVDVWIEFVRNQGFFSNVTVGNIKWQLVRNT